MTRQQLTAEITKLLKSTSDSVLEEVLAYLKTTKNEKPEIVDLSQNLRKILSEDKELLQRLAK